MEDTSRYQHAPCPKCRRWRRVPIMLAEQWGRERVYILKVYCEECHLHSDYLLFPSNFGPAHDAWYMRVPSRYDASELGIGI